MNLREWFARLVGQRDRDEGVRLTSAYEKRREEEALREFRYRASKLRARAGVQQDGK